MYYEVGALIFLAGLAAGSFLNVVIARLEDIKSIFTSRSHCPECKETLRWYDLIPLVSFVLLRTKCRYCREPISWQYPLVEIGTALIWLLSFIMLGFNWQLAYYLLVFSLLIIVFVQDIKTLALPEGTVWACVILALAGGWYFGNFSVGSAIIGGIVAAALPAILVVVSKEKWMGAGDIEISLILGFLLGYPRVIVGLFSAFILGSLVGLALIALRRKKAHDSLPFAPFLITGLLFALFFGDFIHLWYIGLFSLNY